MICALGTPSPRKPGTLLPDGTENLIAAMTEPAGTEYPQQALAVGS